MTAFTSVRKQVRREVLPVAERRPTASRLSQTEEDGRDVLRSLWLRKWHILACGFFLGLSMFSLAARQPSQYSAEASMILDPRGHHFVSETARVVEDLELSNAVVESAVEVLKSPKTMRAVVDGIGIDAFKNIHASRRSYGPVGNAADVVKRWISGVSNDPDFALIPTGERRHSEVVGVLVKHTKVERVGASYAVRLNVTSADPIVSSMVANQLVEQYVGSQLKERRALALSATTWLEEQVEQRRLDLLSAEQSIQEFRQTWLQQDGRSDEVLEQQVGALNREQALVRAERVAEAARLAKLEDIFGKAGFLAVAETLQTPVVLELRAHGLEISNEIERLEDTLGRNHPDRLDLMKDLELVMRDIEAEVTRLLEATRTEIGVLSARESSLAKDVIRLEALRVQLAQSGLELAQLTAARDIAKEGYLGLARRLDDARAQSEIQRTEARLLTAAQIPTGPSAPRPKLMGFFGLTVGTSLGLLLVLAFEALGPGFHSARELERLFGVPVLAQLPQPSNPFWVLFAQRFKLRLPAPKFHRFQRLRAKIAAGFGEGCIRTTVFDLEPSGKSARIAEPLADCLGSEGKRVLLVRDKAELSEVFGLPDPQSISTVDVIPNGNFDVLELDLYGRLPRLRESLHAFESRYDCIVVEANFLRFGQSSTDLASWSDQVILNVVYRKTARSFVLHALDCFEDAGKPPLGFIFSRIPARFDPGF